MEGKSIPEIKLIALATIRNIRDLIKFRKICPRFEETIDFYCDEIWCKMMTRQDFIDAARVDFTPLIDRYEQILVNSEIEIKPQPNLFPALAMAGYMERKNFYNNSNYSNINSYYQRLKGLVKAENNMLLLVAARTGDYSYCEKLLDGKAWNERYRATSEELYEEHGINEELALQWDAATADLQIDPCDCGNFEEFFEIGFLNGMCAFNMACLAGSERIVKLFEERGFRDHYAFNSEGEITSIQLAAEKVSELKPGPQQDEAKAFVRYLFAEGVSRPIYRINPHRNSYLTEEMYEYLGRLCTNDELQEETSGFNKEDYEMLVRSGNTEMPWSFIITILIFGNKTYYPMALNTILKNHYYFNNTNFVECLNNMNDNRDLVSDFTNNRSAIFKEICELTEAISK